MKRLLLFWCVLMFVPNILLAQVTPCEQREKMLNKLGSQTNKFVLSICKDRVCTSAEMMELVKKVKRLKKEEEDAISIYGSELITTTDPRVRKVATAYKETFLRFGLHKSENKKLLAEISGYDILILAETFNFCMFFILLFFLLISIIGIGIGITYKEKTDTEEFSLFLGKVFVGLLLLILLAGFTGFF